MTPLQVEFAVDMTCSSCVEAVRAALASLGDAVQASDINLEAKRVVVTSSLPSHIIMAAISNKGLRVKLRAMGSALESAGVEVANLGAAVCILNATGGSHRLENEGVCGVVRFVQVSEAECVIEGTLDNLTPGLHGLHVHEFGDLSDGCLSAGDHYNPHNEVHGDRMSYRRHVGDLGNVAADWSGRASFRFSDALIKVWDSIGRSLVVHAGEDDLGLGCHTTSPINGNSGARVVC
eukprot:Opistho-2@19352